MIFSHPTVHSPPTTLASLLIVLVISVLSPAAHANLISPEFPELCGRLICPEVPTVNTPTAGHNGIFTLTESTLSGVTEYSMVDGPTSENLNNIGAVFISGLAQVGSFAGTDHLALFTDVMTITEQEWNETVNLSDLSSNGPLNINGRDILLDPNDNIRNLGLIANIPNTLELGLFDTLFGVEDTMVYMISADNFTSAALSNPACNSAFLCFSVGAEPSTEFLVVDKSGSIIDYSFVAATTVPEPTSFALLASGLLGFGAIRRTKKQS